MANFSYYYNKKRSHFKDKIYTWLKDKPTQGHLQINQSTQNRIQEKMPLEENTCFQESQTLEPSHTACHVYEEGAREVREASGECRGGESSVYSASVGGSPGTARTVMADSYELSRARHCSKCASCMNSFNPHSNRYCHYTHVTEETGT